MALASLTSSSSLDQQIPSSQQQQELVIWRVILIFPAQRGVHNLDLGKGESWGQGDAPGLYLRLKETSQEWDHGAGGGSIGQLSEDLLPKEGQVPQQRALTEHSQLSGPQPGSHWGSPVLGQDRTLLLP